MLILYGPSGVCGIGIQLRLFFAHTDPAYSPERAPTAVHQFAWPSGAYPLLPRSRGSVLCRLLTSAYSVLSLGFGLDTSSLAGRDLDKDRRL